MDELSVQFATASALKAIDDCQDLTELKSLTRTLVQGHFANRKYIAMLIKQQLDATFTTTRAEALLEATQPPAANLHASGEQTWQPG